MKITGNESEQVIMKELGFRIKQLNGNSQFNQWVQVSVELGSLSDQLWFFVNFDNGSGGSKLGNEDVTIYMDEFQITDNSWGPKNMILALIYGRLTQVMSREQEFFGRKESVNGRV